MNENGALSIEHAPLFVLVLESLTDPEHMSIRMTHVHLSDTPGHIGGWPRNLETLLEAVLMNSVNIFHPDRHPDAPITLFLAMASKCVRL